MSGNGRLRALLEARRRERIRIENVQNQCRGLISAMENELRKLGSSIIQGLGDKLVDFTKRLNQLKANIEGSPDATLKAINTEKHALVSIINEGKQKSEEWDQYRLDWEKALLDVTISVESLSECKFKLGKENYQVLIVEVNQIRDVGIENTELRHFDEILNKVQQINEDIESENVTREIIKSVRKILTERGFTPSKPKHSTSKQGTVELTGMLNPGRNAKFWISPDGEIEFDFEGYSGTSCKETIDDITLQLKQFEDVDVEILQFEWHNPDKIEKGAKDFPIGGQVRRKGL